MAAGQLEERFRGGRNRPQRQLQRPRGARVAHSALPVTGRRPPVCGAVAQARAAPTRARLFPRSGKQTGRAACVHVDKPPTTSTEKPNSRALPGVGEASTGSGIMATGEDRMGSTFSAVGGPAGWRPRAEHRPRLRRFLPSAQRPHGGGVRRAFPGTCSHAGASCNRST